MRKIFIICIPLMLLGCVLDRDGYYSYRNPPPRVFVKENRIHRHTRRPVQVEQRVHRRVRPVARRTPGVVVKNNRIKRNHRGERVDEKTGNASRVHVG